MGAPVVAGRRVLIVVALIVASCSVAACTTGTLIGHGSPASRASTPDFPSATPAPGGTSSASPSTSAPSSSGGETLTFRLTGRGGPFPVTLEIDGKRTRIAAVRLPWTRTVDGTGQSYELVATFRGGQVQCTVVRGDGTVLITSQAGGTGTSTLRCGAHR